MNKDITPRNEKGQPHGYWEFYYYNGKLMFKGNFVNGNRDGCFIEYHNNSYYKFFYKNGETYYKNRFVRNHETFYPCLNIIRLY